MKLTTTLILLIGLTFMWYNPSTWSTVDGIQNQFGNISNAAESFQGSSPSQVYTSNPTGQLPTSNSYSAPTQDPAVLGAQTPYAGGGSYGGTSGGYAAPAPVDPYAAQRTSYTNQLNGQLGQLDNQQNIGLQNIGDSYNQQGSRLDQQKGMANRNYDMSTQQNKQGYANNRSNTISNTRATQNALQRLLGLNGSGNSSAAYEQAPYAAALQGTLGLNQAQQTYGNNERQLDTNWQDTQRGYTNAFDDLNNQKYQQENGLRSSIAQTRAGILNQLGTVNNTPGQYDSQISELLSQITNLGKQYQNPVLRTADVNYAAPDVNNYNMQRAPSIQQQQAGGAQGDINPTFLSVLGSQQKRDKYGLTSY